jgi:transcription initiation factor TFIIB
MESVISACIYASCRTYNIPRTLDEIANASEIERKEIGRTYRFITRKLTMTITPSSPKDYISRFASILHLSPKTQNDSLKILQKAETSELTSGRGPAGIAAASLYVASLLNNEKRTQREVADVAGITEVTIRNRYKELLDKLGLEDKVKIKEVEKKASRKK